MPRTGSRGEERAANAAAAMLCLWAVDQMPQLHVYASFP